MVYTVKVGKNKNKIKKQHQPYIRCSNTIQTLNAFENRPKFIRYHKNIHKTIFRVKSAENKNIQSRSEDIGKVKSERPPSKLSLRYDNTIFPFLCKRGIRVKSGRLTYATSRQDNTLEVFITLIWTTFVHLESIRKIPAPKGTYPYGSFQPKTFVQK